MNLEKYNKNAHDYFDDFWKSIPIDEKPSSGDQFGIVNVSLVKQAFFAGMTAMALNNLYDENFKNIIKAVNEVAVSCQNIVSVMLSK